MAGQGISLAAITIGKETWFDLSRYGDKHVFRFYTESSKNRVSEPSGHKIFEMVVKGSVKWKPRDPSTLNLQNIEPLGARKK